MAVLAVPGGTILDRFRSRRARRNSSLFLAAGIMLVAGLLPVFHVLPEARAQEIGSTRPESYLAADTVDLSSATSSGGTAATGDASVTEASPSQSSSETSVSPSGKISHFFSVVWELGIHVSGGLAVAIWIFVAVLVLVVFLLFQRTGHRFLVAILVGLAGSTIVWVATPYNNFILHNSYIADSFMPPASLFAILLLVLIINPVLNRFARRWALSHGQLALAAGMILVASHLPGQGLLRMLPYMIARNPVSVSENAPLAKAYEEMDLPPSLFPDKIGKGVDTPVSDDFLGQLKPGEPVPWAAWIPPLLSWGAFMFSVWLMMVGMALIVLPQWRRNERLSFPLLTVFQGLIENPDEGRFFAPLFRKKSFWIAAITVLVLQVLAGWHEYNPQGIPAIPLSWDLGRYFTEEPLRHLPGHIKANRIYFIFLGVAFFMPNRIGFSLWFFVVAYGIYRVIGIAYFPPHYDRAVVEHRMGAMWALTFFVLWLGRAQWKRVFRCMVTTPRNDTDRRERRSGIMLLVGCLGMFAWMVWIGVQPGWAAFFVWYAFMVSLIVTRIVAETGVPFIRIDAGYQMGFLRLFPISMLGPVTFWFSYVMAVLFTIASRVSAATLATHAIGLDEKATPKRQASTASVLVGLLVIGLVICGAVQLYASYHHSVSLDGQQHPIAPWGTGRLDPANTGVLELLSGRLDMPPYSMSGHLAFGAGLAAVLQWLCLMTPRWPIDPMGLLMANTFYSNHMWVSVFLGWLMRVLILKYGGPRVYRAAQPVFLGLIMGEVFAAVYWGFDPAVRVLLGLPYRPIPIQPY